jgi:hypothetical protein
MSDLLTTTSTEAPDFSSIYDLDLTNTDELFDDSSDYVPASLASQKVYDVSWKAHRTVKFNSERLNWVWPATRKEIEEKTARPQELSQIPDHHIVGVRGVPVKIQYGFSLSTGTGSETKTLCYTTRVEEMLGNNSRVIEDRMPLDVPLRRINKRKAEPNEPNPWLLENPHVKLYGSRPPVGLPDNASYSKPRLCVDCVHAGEHYIGTEEEFISGKEIPTCRMNGTMLFCVMEVGILDYSELLEDPAEGRMKITWKKLADANISTTNSKGERVKIERPIMLKIQGLGLSQHASIGNGEYDWQVILPEDSNQCWLPQGGQFMSMGDYYKHLHDPRFYGIRHRKLKNQQLAYSQVTEVFLGKLKAKKFNMDYIPVFRAVTEPEIIEYEEGITAQNWMLTGLQILQLEKAEAANMGGVESAAVLPAAAPKKPAPKQVKPAVAAKPKAAEAPVNPEEEEFNAFQLNS